MWSNYRFTLHETNIAPRNGWLEEEISYWEGLLSGDPLFSGRVIWFNPNACKVDLTSWMFVAFKDRCFIWCRWGVCVFPQTGLFVGSMLVSLQSCCLFVATLPYLKLLKVTQDCAYWKFHQNLSTYKLRACVSGGGCLGVLQQWNWSWSSDTTRNWRALSINLAPQKLQKWRNRGGKFTRVFLAKSCMLFQSCKLLIVDDYSAKKTPMLQFFV